MTLLYTVYCCVRLYCILLRRYEITVVRRNRGLSCVHACTVLHPCLDRKGQLLGCLDRKGQLLDGAFCRSSSLLRTLCNLGWGRLAIATTQPRLCRTAPQRCPFQHRLQHPTQSTTLSAAKTRGRSMQQLYTGRS